MPVTDASDQVATLNKYGISIINFKPPGFCMHLFSLLYMYLFSSPRLFPSVAIESLKAVRLIFLSKRIEKFGCCLKTVMP